MWAVLDSTVQENKRPAGPRFTMIRPEFETSPVVKLLGGEDVKRGAPFTPNWLALPIETSTGPPALM
jgi:hypothetical protein